MPVIFDYTCSECNGVDEYMTRNSDTVPIKCKLCESETATFKKHLVGPCFIEGDTPGSRPPRHGKYGNKKIKNISDLHR